MEKQLSALDKEMSTLDKIGKVMGDVRPGDVIATATLSPEARQVYSYLLSGLEQGNKEVQKSARTAALVAARMTDRLVSFHREAGEAGYTAMDALPELLTNAGQETQEKEAAQRFAQAVESQKEAVRRQYEGTEMWMKAPNGQPTNLTEDQWLAVRTPAFKAWFGDWEVEASLVLPRQANNLDEAVKEARTFAGREITNYTLGITAVLSRKNIGKMTSATATNKSVNAKVHAAAVANIDKLFKTAIAEYTHKDRSNDPNIQKIHRMFSPFVIAHEVFVAKLTVKELAQTKEGNRIYSVEAVEIKEASRKWNAAYNTTKGLLTSFPQEAFDKSVSKILAKINTASKVVDENGEPLVVYHRTTGGGFAIFDRSYGSIEGDWATAFILQISLMIHQ